VREFGENFFSTDGQIILCKFCEVKVSHDKRYSITQHIKTEKHLKSVNLLQNKQRHTCRMLSTVSTLSTVIVSILYFYILYIFIIPLGISKLFCILEFSMCSLIAEIKRCSCVFFINCKCMVL